jgi:hypothetical protein
MLVEVLSLVYPGLFLFLELNTSSIFETFATFCHKCHKCVFTMIYKTLLCEVYVYLCIFLNIICFIYDCHKVTTHLQTL